MSEAERAAFFTLRERRGATAVACCSLPVRPAWRALSTLARADAFPARDVPARLRRRRKDPGTGIGQVARNLARGAGQA